MPCRVQEENGVPHGAEGNGVPHALWGAGGKWGAPRGAGGKCPRGPEPTLDVSASPEKRDRAVGCDGGGRGHANPGRDPRLLGSQGLAGGAQALKREGQGWGGGVSVSRELGWACDGLQGDQGPQVGAAGGGLCPSSEAHPHPRLPAQLNRSATLNQYVKRIRLPSPHVDLKPGTVCYVMGWGDTSNYGDRPTELMETATTIVKRSLCRTLWRGKVSPNMLCGASRNTTLQGVCTVSALPTPCPQPPPPPPRRPASLPPTPLLRRATPADPWSSIQRFTASSRSLGRGAGTAGTLTSTPRFPTTSTGCIAPCKGTAIRRGSQSPSRGWEGVPGADGLRGEGPRHLGCLAAPRRGEEDRGSQVLPAPGVLGADAQGSSRGDTAPPTQPQPLTRPLAAAAFAFLNKNLDPKLLSIHLPCTHPAPLLKGGPQAGAPGTPPPAPAHPDPAPDTRWGDQDPAWDPPAQGASRTWAGFYPPL